MSVCLCSTSQTDITVIKHILQQYRIKELTSSNDEDVQPCEFEDHTYFQMLLGSFQRTPLIAQNYCELDLLVKLQSMMVGQGESYFI